MENFGKLDDHGTDPVDSPKFELSRGNSNDNTSSKLKSNMSLSKVTRKVLNMSEVKYKLGRITNRYLLDFDDEYELKLRSGISREFTTVDEKTWKYLKKWYGCDIEFEYDGYEDTDPSGQATEEGGESEEGEGESENSQEEQEQEEQNESESSEAD